MLETLAAICFTLMPTHYLAVWSCKPGDGLWERYNLNGRSECTTEVWLPPSQFDCRVYDWWWGVGPTRPGEIWYKLEG